MIERRSWTNLPLLDDPILPRRGQVTQPGRLRKPDSISRRPCRSNTKS